MACNRCSNHKLPLPYDCTKSWRVCDPCHEVLVTLGRRETANISPATTPELAPSPPSLRSSLLEVNSILFLIKMVQILIVSIAILGGCGDTFRLERISESQDPWQNVAEALVRPAFRFCALLVSKSSR